MYIMYNSDMWYNGPLVKVYLLVQLMAMPFLPFIIFCQHVLLFFPFQSQFPGIHLFLL